jgi:hypothetical protein
MDRSASPLSGPQNPNELDSMAVSDVSVKATVVDAQTVDASDSVFDGLLTVGSEACSEAPSEAPTPVVDSVSPGLIVAPVVDGYGGPCSLRWSLSSVCCPVPLTLVGHSGGGSPAFCLRATSSPTPSFIVPYSPCLPVQCDSMDVVRASSPPA